MSRLMSIYVCFLINVVISTHNGQLAEDLVIITIAEEARKVGRVRKRRAGGEAAASTRGRELSSDTFSGANAAQYSAWLSLAGPASAPPASRGPRTDT